MVFRIDFFAVQGVGEPWKVWEVSKQEIPVYLGT